MAVRDPVLLVTKEAETVADVSAALVASNGRFELAAACGILPDLVSRLEKSHPAAALVDIDPEPTRIFEDLAPIVARFAETRFVVLSSTLRNELVLEAMQIGARHFLVKRSIGVELFSVLQRLVPSRFMGAPGRGVVTTLLSAGGGCGTTTLALNLANEIGLKTSEAALLVDMDCSYGSAAQHLGLKAEYGIADVSAYDGQIDGHLIRSSAVAYSDALHALLSPAAISFSQPQPLRYEFLGDVLKACKHSYPYTVIDAPRVSMDVAAVLAKASNVTLIVFQLMVKDIHVMRSIRSALIDRDVARDGIIPLVSRYGKRSPISLKEAEKALGGMKLRVVRNDFRSAVRSINYAEPLAQAAPSSVLRRDIRQLAVDVGLKEETSFQTRSKG